eukprot:1240251-Prymnesium_polylepis.2
MSRVAEDGRVRSCTRHKLARRNHDALCQKLGAAIRVVPSGGCRSMCGQHHELKTVGRAATKGARCANEARVGQRTAGGGGAVFAACDVVMASIARSGASALPLTGGSSKAPRRASKGLRTAPRAPHSDRANLALRL